MKLNLSLEQVGFTAEAQRTLRGRRGLSLEAVSFGFQI
jgi:hypothetical protein